MNSGSLVINWITGVKKSKLTTFLKEKLFNNSILIKVGEKCNHDKFECVQSNYCIDPFYYCDKIPHCNDTSDEPSDCKLKLTRSSFPLYHILIILSSITIFILVSSIFIVCKLNFVNKKQKKKRVKYLGQPVFHKYSPTNSMDYLEAAITSV
jgi:hypothetical protein